jgi:DNA-binding transcriptional regulator YiaG
MVSWIAMSHVRDYRRMTGLCQREFAALVGVPLETLRAWDSGRRLVLAPGPLG